MALILGSPEASTVRSTAAVTCPADTHVHGYAFKDAFKTQPPQKTTSGNQLKLKAIAEGKRISYSLQLSQPLKSTEFLSFHLNC